MLDLWRQGRVRDALTIASEHGELVMAGNAHELQERMIADYCAAIESGEDAVMITQRRADARNLNDRARARLDATGRLGAARIELAGGQFAVGDRVVLKLNDRRLGVENGNRRSVVAIDLGANSASVELTGGSVITLPWGYLQRRTTMGDPTVLHAYAGTTHIAQGITTGHAFVLGSDTAYREWGYVAWSRARLQTRFYICEPDAEQANEEHHIAAVEQREAFEDVVNAMQRSRAQHAASELVDPATIGRIAERSGARGSSIAHGQSRGDDGKRRAISPREAGGTTTDLRRGRPRQAQLANGDEVAVASSALGVRRDPPGYVVDALGERPTHPTRAEMWDRGIAQIERYRFEHDVTSTDDALGERPAELPAQVAWRHASRDIERCRRELARVTATRSRGRSL